MEQERAGVDYWTVQYIVYVQAKEADTVDEAVAIANERIKADPELHVLDGAEWHQNDPYISFDDEEDDVRA